MPITENDKKLFKIRTPYGVKNWNYIKKLMDEDTAKNMIIRQGCPASSNIEELTESFINGNFSYCKDAVKNMDKYTFLQYIFALQDAKVNDEKIEKLVN